MLGLLSGGTCLTSDLHYTMTFEASALVLLLLCGCLHWMAGAIQSVRPLGLQVFSSVTFGPLTILGRKLNLDCIAWSMENDGYV